MVTKVKNLVALAPVLGPISSPELPGTSMAFTMIVSKFERKSLPTKILSFFALTAQPHQNITNKSDLSKLMIQTREPIPTYTLLNLVSLLWTWYFKQGVSCHKFSISLINYFVKVFTSCGKWLGWNIIQMLASRYSSDSQ